MKKMLVSQESNKSKRRVWSKTQGGVRRVKDQERNFWPYNRLLRVRTDMTHLPATCILGRCKSTCHFLGQYFPCKTGNLFSLSIRACSTNWILKYSQFCGYLGKISFKYSSYQMDAKHHLKMPPNTQHLSVLYLN